MEENSMEKYDDEVVVETCVTEIVNAMLRGMYETLEAEEIGIGVRLDITLEDDVKQKVIDDSVRKIGLILDIDKESVAEMFSIEVVG